jgi:hypothetical protein
LFEHWLNLKPWDLERMSMSQVFERLEWVKAEKAEVDRLRGESGGV